MGKSLFKMRIT